MKKFLFAAMAIAAMTSCSKDEPAIAPEGGLAEIKLTSGISFQTKAAYNGDVAVTGLQFLRVDGSATTSDFTGKTAFSGSRAVLGAITFDNAQNYKETDNTYIASYFPAGSVSANVVTWNVDAKTDIMTAATIDAGSNASHDTPGSLVYKHHLAQIEVICKAATADNSIQTRWGKIQGIKLKSTPTTMTLAYNGLGVTPGVTTSDIALVQPDYTTNFTEIDLPINTNTTANAAGMFVPSASQSFQLEVTTATGTKVITIDLGTGKQLKVGEKHVITLTFNPASAQDPISVSSTIEAWNTGATGNGTLN